MGAAVYLRASDLCIGWVFPRILGRRTVVCVLPKPWLPHAEVTRPAAQKLGPDQLLKRRVDVEGAWLYYCFQGEVLDCGAIAKPGTPADESEEVSEVLNKLHEYATAELKPKPRRWFEPDSDEAEELEDEFDADARATKRLFASSHKPRSAVDAKPHELDGRALQAALIRLLNKARPNEWMEALAFQTDPLFRLAVAQHYVSALAEVASRMRRGYIERRELLTSPRGRVVASSVGRSEATGEPSIICEYNDFEKDLPLHRVLASALIIATVALTKDDENSELLTQAYRIRHQLEGIATLPRTTAHAVAKQLRLTPAQRLIWQRPLQLARAVLADWSPTSADADPDDTPDLTIPSASLWERIIAHTLKTDAQLRVLDGGKLDGGKPDPRKLSQPWKTSSYGFRADLIVQRRGQPSGADIILDAKYTTLWRPSNRQTPVVPVAHTRQLFAYGLLWRKLPTEEKTLTTEEKTLTAEERTLTARDVGLVYVAPPAGRATKPQLTWIPEGQTEPYDYQGPSLSTIKDGSWNNTWPRLFVLAMAFPTPGDCASDAALQSYNKDVGEKWRERLDTSVGQTPPTEAAK